MGSNLTSAIIDCPDRQLRISQRSFARIAQFVTAELGIKMPESKLPMVQSRLLHRVRDLGIESIDEYCDRLFSGGLNETERALFIDQITTNKTDFFREPRHFSYLVQTALPQILRTSPGGDPSAVSVWSAGCSSGEEPYTLAMVLSEYAAANPRFDFRILATDVSTKVLRIAQDGVYAMQQIEPVPAGFRRKYLLRSRGEPRQARVSPELRRKVSFHRLNFMDEKYCVQDMFDVIFCRNVLIYFDRPTQQAVIEKLCRNLKPRGYLFISHSEWLSGLALPLVSLGSSCFRKQDD